MSGHEWSEPYGWDCSVFCTPGHVEISGAPAVWRLAKHIGDYCTWPVDALRNARICHAWLWDLGGTGMVSLGRHPAVAKGCDDPQPVTAVIL